jgi:hypothetical protein
MPCSSKKTQHALREKGTILIKGVPVADATPFENSVDGRKLDELTAVIPGYSDQLT